MGNLGNMQHTHTCMTHLLTCPVCHLRFTKVANTLKCANGHSFDIAKEGYVNLLTKKVAESAGDSKAMLQARRTFLEQGHYQPLSDTLNELIAGHLHREYANEEEPLPHLNLLDIGCGEGYYIGRLQHYLTQQFATLPCCYLGMDIAKDALRMAAKRYKTAQFVVADVWEHLSFASDTLHVLLNIFAPRNIAEFARVLMPGGILLIVFPGSQHLAELRSQLALLSIEEEKEQHISTQCRPYFDLLTTRTQRSPLHLKGAEVTQIVTMTPNFRHLSTEMQATLHAIEEIHTQTEFIVQIWQKRTQL